MRGGRRILLALGLMLALGAAAIAEDRFPRPEFSSGYQYPDSQVPLPRGEAWIWIDSALLLLFLCAAAWLSLKKRSRKLLLLLSLLSVAYFGLVRRGCVCAVGSLQNAAQALFQPEAALPLAVALFFALPILFALFTGRSFCAGVCPFGAAQELLLIKPLRVPAWLDRSLGVFRALYLGLAVVAAASGAGFLICRFDPFVGFFRLAMPLPMMLISFGVVGLSTFIGRPYCRWICPYGLILEGASLLSKRHPSIAGGECVDCRLCEASCPYDAIETPFAGLPRAAEEESRKQLRKIVAASPLLLALGVLVGLGAAELVAPLHPEVALANEMASAGDFAQEGESQERKAFLASGRSLEDLDLSAEAARKGIQFGSAIAGGCAAAIFLGGWFALYKKAPRKGYKVHSGRCLSCGRCFEFCPVGKGPAPGGDPAPGNGAALADSAADDARIDGGEGR